MMKIIKGAGILAAFVPLCYWVGSKLVYIRPDFSDAINYACTLFAFWYFHDEEKAQ